MNKKEISVIIPVYHGENFLSPLVQKLKSTFIELQVSYEIILVDDRSPDNSWAIMQELYQKHSELKIIRLSRNFGQQPAIIAGLSESYSTWSIVMDCDLQDQPSEIKKLYKKAKEGYDSVLARRINRQDTFRKKATSKLFSTVFTILTDIKFNNEIGNFGIYNEKVINQVLKIGDHLIAFPLFCKWVGFKQIEIPIEHAKRHSGKTSYTYTKLIRLAFNTLISFSNKPLKIFAKLGIILSSFSFLVGLYYLYQSLKGNIDLLGFSSLIISIWFLSGLIIASIGITGIYIGKIFDQTKNRAPFIIDEKFPAKNLLKS